MKKQVLLNEPKRVNVIGVPISVVNLDIAVDFVANNLDNIRGEYICASNAHTCVTAHEDSNYLKVQSESIMSLPDGKPLAVAGKKKGFKEMEKTTGMRFMQSIFNDKRFSNCRHYFYGNSEDRLTLMIEKLKVEYPDLNICGYEPSVFHDLNNQEINDLINRINESDADFVWIGLGAPKQELLMHKMKDKTNTIMTGVGGVFNIFAGVVSDAPMWMQKVGLEWFYRLIKEPKRLFKRYLFTNTKYIMYCFFQKD